MSESTAWTQTHISRGSRATTTESDDDKHVDAITAAAATGVLSTRRLSLPLLPPLTPTPRITHRRGYSNTAELKELIDAHLAWQDGNRRPNSRGTLFVDWDGSGRPLVSYRVDEKVGREYDGGEEDDDDDEVEMEYDGYDGDGDEYECEEEEDDDDDNEEDEEEPFIHISPPAPLRTSPPPSPPLPTLTLISTPTSPITIERNSIPVRQQHRSDPTPYLQKPLPPLPGQEVDVERDDERDGIVGDWHCLPSPPLALPPTPPVCTLPDDVPVEYYNPRLTPHSPSDYHPASMYRAGYEAHREYYAVGREERAAEPIIYRSHEASGSSGEMKKSSKSKKEKKEGSVGKWVGVLREEGSELLGALKQEREGLLEVSKKERLGLLGTLKKELRSAKGKIKKIF
jgi:hypothetical protein